MPCTITSSPARASRCRSSTVVGHEHDELPNHEGIRKEANKIIRVIYHFSSLGQAASFSEIISFIKGSWIKKRSLKRESGLPSRRGANGDSKHR